MKKAFVILVICMITVLAISVIGCGSSEESEKTANYKKLLNEAEELRVAADTGWDALYEKIKESNRTTEQVIMAALGGDTSGLTPEQTTGLTDNARALIQEAEQVKTKYQAMVKPEYKELEGVNAYVTYAEAMIATIDAYEVLLESGASFLARVEPLLASGDTAGLQSLIQQSSDEVTRIQDEQRAAEAALKNAEDIKSYEQLGEK